MRLLRTYVTLLRCRSVLIACVVGLSPATAFAQAAPPAPVPTPSALDGWLAFAYLGTTGNASTQTIGLSGEVILRPDMWVVRNKAAFVRNESDGALTVESFTYLFRADGVLSTRSSAFGEYTYFRDEFAGVEHRNALIGGVSYTIVGGASHALSVDGGLGYVNEHRLVGPDVSSGTYAFGARYRWKVSATAELSEDSRLTGTFAAAGDWRVDNVVSIAAQLTSLFSLKVSNTIRYANIPVPGFKNTDTNTAIALVATF